MGEHVCTVRWERRGAPFAHGTYSRAHTWRFDGGVVVPASASPHVVTPPLADPSGVDPEEALVAALSSCHMLSFLWLASRQGLVVDAYDDDAVGHLRAVAPGREAVTHVRLRPRVRFAAPLPAEDVVAALHHEAHELCFIANSVRTAVEVAPAPPVATPAADGAPVPRVPVAAALEQAVARALPRLTAQTEGYGAGRVRPGGWTRKETLAHLVDSACVNHDRFVRASRADAERFPGYDADGWVAAQRVEVTTWVELVALWGALNRRLVRVLEGLPPAAWAHRCQVGDDPPTTLAALADDYVVHARHHLTQVVPGRGPDPA
jgi:organic hydroperoxide reductase OsmC/OhrA